MPSKPKTMTDSASKDSGNVAACATSPDKGKCPKRKRDTITLGSGDAIASTSSSHTRDSMGTDVRTGGDTAAILNLLTEIKDNQGKLTARMDKLENDCYYEGGDNEFVDDTGIELIEPPVKVKRSTSDASEESVSAADASQSDVNKPSLFKDIASKFLVKEQCEDPIDDDFAKIINALFRDGISDDKYNDLIKKFNRPENCDGLTSVRVNQLIWDIIRPETRSLDTKFQSVQASLVKGAICITQLVCELAKLKDSPSDKIDLGKLMDLGTDSLALLGNTNRLLNLRRRDCMKADLKHDYLHLCSATVPFTEHLFGDDITKRVKDIQEVNRAGNKISTWQQRGGYNRGRMRGRGFRFRGRGRGNFRQLNEASKNYPRGLKPQVKSQMK
ncbi:uncharacterized protein [Ptychodera flava]|uniref:uncharacterized protein n=1 Tax=Ptychodera flava TaxID=63121 RepID=UPI003969D708